MEYKFFDEPVDRKSKSDTQNPFLLENNQDKIGKVIDFD
jgi:hypothetical protein